MCWASRWPPGMCHQASSATSYWQRSGRWLYFYWGEIRCLDLGVYSFKWQIEVNTAIYNQLLLLSLASQRWSILGPLLWLNPFRLRPPMVQHSIDGGVGGREGQRGLSRPLSGHPTAGRAPPNSGLQGMVCRNCTLPEWMDSTPKLGHSLQFCSVPPPFRGMREHKCQLSRLIHECLYK